MNNLINMFCFVHTQENLLFEKFTYYGSTNRDRDCQSGHTLKKTPTIQYCYMNNLNYVFVHERTKKLVLHE